MLESFKVGSWIIFSYPTKPKRVKSRLFLILMADSSYQCFFIFRATRSCLNAFQIFLSKPMKRACLMKMIFVTLLVIDIVISCFKTINASTLLHFTKGRNYFPAAVWLLRIKGELAYSMNNIMPSQSLRMCN